MKQKNFSRRKFIGTLSAGTLGAVALSGLPTFSFGKKKRSPNINKLAVLGGEPVREKGWKDWPNCMVDDKLLDSVMKTAREGPWCRIYGGARTPEWQEEFAKLTNTKHCIAVGSGTQALHTAVEALGIGAGDEVITSPLTDPGTQASILAARALPVMADLDPASFQNDADDIERRITENTKAIMPVHIAGMPCDMERIMEIARKHKLWVIEDACQAHLSEFQGKQAGTIGDLGCFSFQSSKTISCGEGGAIIGNDKELLDRCYTIQNRGQSREGRTELIATKYRMNEWEAAVLLGQLHGIRDRFELRNDNADRLTSRLKDIPGITPQKQYKGTGKYSGYLYMMRYDKQHFNNAPRSKFLEAVNAEGAPITAYLSQGLHKEPWVYNVLNRDEYKKFFSRGRLQQYRYHLPLPNTDKACEEELLMVWSSGPFLEGRSDMDDIADAITKVYENRDKLNSI